MAGVATEKPGSHRYPDECFVFHCSYWLNRNLNMTLFICSLKLGVDTEKLRIQMAAFLNTWFPYFMTITFQCFSCGSKVSYRKALVCLHKELSLY